MPQKDLRGREADVQEREKNLRIREKMYVQNREAELFRILSQATAESEPARHQSAGPAATLRQPLESMEMIHIVNSFL
jgi:hypothetical protein